MSNMKEEKKKEPKHYGKIDVKSIKNRHHGEAVDRDVKRALPVGSLYGRIMNSIDPLLAEEVKEEVAEFLRKLDSKLVTLSTENGVKKKKDLP